MTERTFTALRGPAASGTHSASQAKVFVGDDKARRRFYSAATLGVVSAVAAAGLAILYARDPAEGGFFPPCPLHYFTGLHCPGCGTLRALHQLLHGNFSAAWAMNPLAIAVMPGLAAAIVCGQVAAWRELPGRISQRLGPKWIWGLFFVIVGFGILRNVPIWPCTLLAPH